MILPCISQNTREHTLQYAEAWLRNKLLKKSDFDILFFFLSFLSSFSLTSIADQLKQFLSYFTQNITFVSVSPLSPFDFKMARS